MSDILKHYPHLKSIVVRIVIYIRVSTKKQAFDENNVRPNDGTMEMQTRTSYAEAERFCSKNNLPYEVIEVIEDAGKSGGSSNRKGILKIKKLASEGQINIVIAKSPDRIYRDTKEYLIFKDYLDSLGVMLLFVDAKFTNDSAGRVFETLTASMAEFYRRQISEKVSTNSRTRLVEDGKINGAGPILGLVSDNSRKGHFTINLEEVEQLEKLLEIYIQSLSEVSAIESCHNKGIKDQGNKEFSKARFKNILKNIEWRYSGKWYLKEGGEVKVVPLPHGPVIREELAKRAVEKRDDYIQVNSRCGASKNKYLLSGILFSSDDVRLHGRPGNKKDKTYLYYTANKLGFSISAEDIERKVCKRVQSYIKRSDSIKKILSQDDHLIKHKKTLTEELKKLGKKRSKIIGEIEILISRLSKLDLNTSALTLLNKSINKLSEEQVKIDNRIETKRSELRSINLGNKGELIEEKLSRYSKRFNKLSFGERREIIFDIFEKIIVLDEYSIKLVMKPYEAGLFEIIQYSLPKAYQSSKEIVSLYQKKGWSLRRIAVEFDCSRHSIKKALLKEGVKVTKESQSEDIKLISKIKGMRSSGLSYQKVADKLNLWKINTLSGKGKWYPKTVRELDIK